MHLRLLFILSLFPVTFLQAQINESFDVEEISDLTLWNGELDEFVINDDKQLQLYAPDNGTSVIYTPTSFSIESQWDLSFNMAFAPSNDNRLRIYLYSDSEELEKGNAYFLEIGESGSDDNLEFYRQDQGDEILLGEGAMGTLGASPANASIKVIRNDDGFWTISAAYGSQPFVQLEFELVDDKYQPDDGFFGIHCTYTSTRKDKFFFDDIYVGPLIVDAEAPQLVRASFVDPSHVSLVFNELITESTALEGSNYVFDNDLGSPLNVVYGEYQNEVILELVKPAEGGVNYSLTISKIQDELENTLNTQVELVLLSKPVSGELIINEILFDPYPDAGDFVELYNNSDKYLDLSTLNILNLDNERSVVLGQDIKIGPKQYLAITSDRTALFDRYMIEIPENIIEHSLPAFNNDEGNVSITFEGEDLLDSYNYSEDDHIAWIDDVEGVSLERIDPSIAAGNIDNWQSAAEQAGFATPGYQNSNFTMENISQSEFVLEKRTFSPDGDGFDDILRLNYRVAEPGFVLNMKVFDDSGHLVKTITSNEILGRTGHVLWNGTTDQGQLAGLGIYVIFLEYFNIDGRVEHKKLSCVLAKQLN